MTPVRTTAITSAVFAAVLAASVSGTAMAGQKQQNQTGGTTPPTGVTTQTNNTASISNWAAVRALQVYQKCKDNILPECP